MIETKEKVMVVIKKQAGIKLKCFCGTCGDEIKTGEPIAYSTDAYGSLLVHHYRDCQIILDWRQWNE